MVKAGEDWSAARKILAPPCTELAVAAFHCQQAVEKALKAYLVNACIDFEKIHDLGRLLDYCRQGDPAFELLRDEVEPLTLYAVAFRYPGPADPVPGEVRAALEVVVRVWAFVATRLPPEAVP